MRRILTWLDEPNTATGIHVARRDDWDERPYSTLREHVHAAAHRYLAAGIRPGDVVSIVQPAADAFLIDFFGTLLAGATPNPLPPLLPMQSDTTYRTKITPLLQAARPVLVSTTPQLAPLLDPAVATIEGAAIIDPTATAAPHRSLPGCQPDGIGLLQFTSGSSGTPKGVRVTVANLEANIHAIATWLGATDNDRVATWLPPYHDMGLIGCLLAPVTHGLTIQAMTPLQFIQHPLRWLARFGRDHATITAAPNFALSHLLSKVHPHDLTGLDFRGWRSLIIGAERIDATVLRALVELLGPHGFDDTTLCPAYGLAEATLAVTGVRPGEPVQLIETPYGTNELTTPVNLMSAHLDDTSRWLVGCGHPLTEVTVDIDTPARRTRTGEVNVGGPGVATGYQTAAGRIPLRHSTSGALATGDVAALVHGQLYPIGRVGDSVKVRAVTVFAEDIETAVAAGCALDGNRVVALTGHGQHGVEIGVVIEDRHIDPRQVRHIVRRSVGTDALVRVFRAKRGTIERTTSGKPRRRIMWTRLHQGDYDTYELADDAVH
ncbi:AMP-binding protein [Nocardia sp. bgisy134]|uniref:AMP-binding protein n=1 Tax=Nocardia sp. bgisy134 TaxID=3413789 RepID=UPI003D7580D0